MGLLTGSLQMTLISNSLSFSAISLAALWPSALQTQLSGNCSSVGGNFPSSIVDQSILQESREDKDDADTTPDINSLGVGHRGEGTLYAGHGGGHGQQGGHTQVHPGRSLKQGDENGLQG